MKQATRNSTIIEPSLATVNHITFVGDLTDETKTFISVSLTIIDDEGEKVQDMVVTIEDITNLNGILTSFQNNILPKIIEKVEQELEVKFV